MYGNNPFYYKNKYYYEVEDVNLKEFRKIEKMLANNEPTSIIQASIDNLNRLNSIFINNSSAQQCPAMAILTASISKILLLETIIAKKNTFKVTITPIEAAIKTEINLKYVKYIQKYGIPDDGVFLPELLAEFD